MLGSFVYFLFVWSPALLAAMLLVLMFRRFLPEHWRLWPIKLLSGLILAAYVVGFLHYTLPQREVVRIIDAYEKRMDVSTNSLFWAEPDAGTTKQDTRDVRFIDTIHEDGSVLVFRNEDTGFGWPPYFKFDSSNISAEAKELVSTKAAPQWVAVRHYGWRNELFSVFPNATSLRPVEGPNVTFFPWFNTIFFVVLGLVLLGIFRLMQRFKRKRVDPMVEGVEDAWDDLGEAGQSIGDRIRGWFASLGGK